MAEFFKGSVQNQCQDSQFICDFSIATTLASQSNCHWLAEGKKIGNFICQIPCDSLSLDYFLRDKICFVPSQWLAKLVHFVWKPGGGLVCFVAKIVLVPGGLIGLLLFGIMIPPAFLRPPGITSTESTTQSYSRIHPLQVQPSNRRKNTKCLTPLATRSTILISLLFAMYGITL